MNTTLLENIEEFDRDFPLRELLPTELQQLLSPIQQLVGTEIALLDRSGSVIGGNLLQVAECVPLRCELEIVGYIGANTANKNLLNIIAHIIEVIIESNRRFRMASSLHQQVVIQDYRELQETNAALQESEKKYRMLSMSLEERVNEQVKTIEQAQLQLYQAEKMASIGQLAAGVAHEINNPIGFIKSNLTTAKTYLDRFKSYDQSLRELENKEYPEKRKQFDIEFVINDFCDLIEESIFGAQRIAGIVSDLKNFSRIDHGGESTTNINEIIQSVVNVSTSQTKDKAKILLKLGVLPLLKCDAGKIGQVLLNLLLNAVQAIESAGEIVIETSLSKGFICINIADNGKGIPPDVLPRIFDPFFTTKEVGQGTGLGLTVSNEIVKAHGGHIEIKSKLNEGTCVSIFMPLLES